MSFLQSVKEKANVARSSYIICIYFSLGILAQLVILSLSKYAVSAIICNSTTIMAHKGHHTAD